MERLDKIISSQRADGRKEVQKLIKSGAVLVNGKICKKPDTKVDPDKDEIVVDGQALNYSKYIYIMMNKPAGVVSATEDRQFKTVIDIIPEDMKRKGLFPVGRLDRDTEGLLLITDDGDFAHSIKLLIPSDKLKKEFIDIAASQRDQIENLNRHNQKLSEARDLLLPRLMSGEIQV